MPSPRRSKPATPKPPDPIVLTGPPTRLRATVTVENTSDARLTVRGSALHLEGGRVATGTAAALIGPGTTASLPVVVPLDPLTSPGTYAAELEVSGARRAAVVHVEPHLSLEVSPGRILAVPGRQSVTLVVANHGNVAMPLAARVVARTDDGGPEPGPDVTLVFKAAVTVEPGGSATLTGRLEVPSTLDPARRHTATLPVGVADLSVIILPHRPSETKP